MGVGSFIQTVWIGQLLSSLKNVLVSEAGVNHNYEGEVMGAGSVKINRLSDVTLRDYTGNNIKYDDLETIDTTLNIDKAKYFAVQVDDVDAVQVKNYGALMAEAMANAAYKLGNIRDMLNFSAMITDGTKIPGSAKVTTAAEAKALVLKMKTAADKANIPAQGRVMFAGPELENMLLSDTTINLAAPTSDDSLKAGYIGKLYGIEIYSSNNVKKIVSETNDTVETDNKDYVILTTPIATTEASQIEKMEALRSESSFKDLVRGLDVSGRKVIMPEAVIVTEVDYSAE